MEAKDKKIKQIKKKTIPKNFDAIKTMRKIRDEISLEIMEMDYEEQRKHLNKLLSKK